MHFLSFLAVYAISGIVSAAPTIQHVVHEQRDHLPAGWDFNSPIDKSTILPVRIGLTQSNLENAYETLMSVADPESSNYGKHWSAEEVSDFFAPSTETVQAVKSWLTSFGVGADRIKQSAGKGWLEFSAPASEVEALLKTEYHEYAHDSGKLHYACEEYSIPANIQRHIDFITPTIHFDSKVSLNSQSKQKRGMEPTVVVSTSASKKKAIKDALAKHTSVVGTKINTEAMSDCDSLITPACLRALYNIPQGTKNLSSFGIVEYAPQTFLQSDLNTFQNSALTSSGIVPVGTAPKVQGIDGGYLVPSSQASAGYQAESDLDLQYAMDLVYPQQVTVFQVGDQGSNSGRISFNNFLDGIDKAYCTSNGGDDTSVDESFPDAGGYKGKEQCGVWKPSSVISTSYTYNEHDLSAAYEQRQCNEYLKLGLLGVSFVYASGDNGVAGQGNQCLAANGSYVTGSGAFMPSFPATCPYVTSVGATQMNSGSSVSDPESACASVIYSGGGFSNVFAQPSYQSSAVSSYFASNAPSYTSAQYNNSQQTRGFPDVSANGASYVVAIDGSLDVVYGTSAAAPTFASVITLINNERLAVNKHALGFLNPILYKNPGMFNDITSGSNPGCGTNGYNAVAGWDPVTGLGTPNYTAMLAVMKTMVATTTYSS